MKAALYTLTILLYMAGMYLQAQDMHFSQNSQSPLILNPANAGEHDALLRCQLQYKNQWSFIMDNPFSSFSFAIDKPIFKKKLNTGILVLNDQAGKGKLGMSSIHIATATKTRLQENSFLKMSLMFGIMQYHVSGSALLWPSQFNGKDFDKTLSNNEINVDYVAYSLDCSGGLLYVYHHPDHFKLNIGLSAFHLINSHYEMTGFPTMKLAKRFNLQSDASVSGVNKKIELQPSVLYIKQGAQHELTSGVGVKYLFGMDSKYTGKNIPSNVTIGLNYRTSAVMIPYIQLEYRKLMRIGISYDIHVSNSLLARGGTELNLTYLLSNQTPQVPAK